MPKREEGKRVALSIVVEQVVPPRNVLRDGTWIAAVRVGEFTVRGNRASEPVEAVRSLLFKLSQAPYAGAPQDVDEAGLGLELAVQGVNMEALFDFTPEAPALTAASASDDEPDEDETDGVTIAELLEEEAEHRNAGGD